MLLSRTSGTTLAFVLHVSVAYFRLRGVMMIDDLTRLHDKLWLEIGRPKKDAVAPRYWNVTVSNLSQSNQCPTQCV